MSVHVFDPACYPAAVCGLRVEDEKPAVVSGDMDAVTCLDCLRRIAGAAVMTPVARISREEASREWPASAQCTSCGRRTYYGADVGRICEMPQPDGSRCAGQLTAMGAASKP